MNHEIKILCPGRKCGKCRRMTARVKEAVDLSGRDATIEMIDSPELLLQYPTWILPSLVINNRMVARGYVPSLMTLLDILNEPLIEN